MAPCKSAQSSSYAVFHILANDCEPSSLWCTRVWKEQMKIWSQVIETFSRGRLYDVNASPLDRIGPLLLLRSGLRKIGVEDEQGHARARGERTGGNIIEAFCSKLQRSYVAIPAELLSALCRASIHRE